MPTIKTIAEIVLDRINGGRSTQDTWDLRTVMHDVGGMRDLYLPNNIRDKFKDEANGSVPSELIEQFPNIAIKYNESLARYYSELPSQFVNLPFEMGVWSVSPMQNQANPYVPVSPAWVSTGDPVVYDISHVYWVQKDKIWYGQWEDTGMTVLMELVPAFTTNPLNEDLEVPSDIAFQIQDELIKRYSQPMRIDSANDGRNQG